MGECGHATDGSLTSSNRAVFLDRDGVINRVLLRHGRPYPPSCLNELQLLPGAAQAIQGLRSAGFRILVVTNQPDVGTGLQRREVVEAMHERMSRDLAIDAIKVCYHTDQDGCTCRKPKPGMLLEAARQWRIDLRRSYMIGDRWRDIEAGKAAGCKTVLVDGQYDERRADNPTAVVSSLLEASVLILTERV